ncbi:MAG: hypothetical protein GXY48_14845 [Methanomicrobiales archaeon]|nr:hypothetical protein [Methanomicrobiales archaeon]
MHIITSFPQEEIITEDPEIILSLDQYLDNVFQQVLRVFYQSYGESEKSSRIQMTLSSVLETLLWKIAGNYGIYRERIPHNSLFSQLVHLGTSIPHYMQDTRVVSAFDTGVRKNMIHAGLTAPFPNNLSCFHIEPITMVRAIHRQIVQLNIRERKKQGEYSEKIYDNSFLTSPVFHLARKNILQKLTADTAIIDPFSGNGELILFFTKSVCDGCIDAISRLKQVSSRIFCLEHSSTALMTTRFGVICAIIGRDFSSPVLFNENFEKENSVIWNNIKVGSLIFTPELNQEYISEDEGKNAIRRYKPLNETWPVIPQGLKGILVTCPSEQSDLTPPEIRQFLCKHFQSYSPEFQPSLIASEKLLTDFIYPTYIFIRKTWLSDINSEPFRKWVRKTRIKSIVIDSTGGSFQDGSWTCLIGDDNKPEIQVTKIDFNGKITRFRVEKSSLPETGGWNLDDPISCELLDLIRKDSIPLVDYCLGALYQPGQILSSGKEEIWISLITENVKFIVSSGLEPKPDAAVIIKGPDMFLQALLSSSLIQWYWKNFACSEDLENNNYHISHLPVRQPDWYDDNERDIICQLTRWMQTRTNLIQKLEYARSHHDISRIQKALDQVEKKRDELVCILYRIPENLREWVLIKQENNSFL